MDPLSDLLRMVRLEGAYFYCVEAADPWSVSTRHARELAPRIMPGSDHLIPYHILTEGRCFVGLLGEDQIEMAAGDVIVFPQGDGHVLSSARGLRLGDDAIAGYPEHYPHAMAIGAGRPPSASFVCGFLGCDLRPFNPLLAALPRQLHMPAMSDGWLDGFTRRLTEEVHLGRAGANGVLTRLAELMFLDLLRRHLEKLPAGQTGWLAGLRDEIVGRVLAVLHARPGHPWTLDELAREVASSRSNVAQRFTELRRPAADAVSRAVAHAGGGESADRQHRQARRHRGGGGVRVGGRVQPRVQAGDRPVTRRLARGAAAGLVRAGSVGAGLVRAEGCRTMREQEIRTLDHWRQGAGAAV